ncbi:MAG: NAD(P)/FAD-dependent oxidoreductase [Legionellaceae bacterium]|nr:NAD(P)/FAD-dependent oxidoreductase [Legionellaceae bacterium]
MKALLFFLTLAFSTMTCAIKVAIIGGGLAGLSAAKKLDAAQIETVLFEASGRLGGRVGTRISPYGTAFYNTGGEFIDSTQSEIRALVSELGLELKEWYQPYHKHLVRNVIYDNQSFQTDNEYLYPFYSHHSEARKYLEELIRDIQLLSFHAHSKRAQKIKKLSIKDYLLEELKFPEKLAHYIFSEAASYYAQEADIINANIIEEMFIDLEVPTYQISHKHDEKYRVIGGTGKIIDKLLQKIPTWRHVRIQLKTPVHTISKSDKKYMINDEAFDYVISTLPPPVLKQIKVDIKGYQDMMATVFNKNNYPYGVVANVYLFFDQRVWKNTAYTDSFGQHYEGYEGRVSFMNEASIWDETNGQLDENGLEISEGIIRAYFSGDSVHQKFINKSPESIHQFVVQPLLNKLEKMWPGLKSTYKGFRFNYCKYAYAGAVPPGMSSEEWSGYPLRIENLIFAGEFFDKSEDQSFMNGAIKSGYRAAEIIKSGQ